MADTCFGIAYEGGGKALRSSLIIGSLEALLDLLTFSSLLPLLPPHIALPHFTSILYSRTGHGPVKRSLHHGVSNKLGQDYRFDVPFRYGRLGSQL